MVFILLAIVVLAACGFAGASMAKAKGKDPAVWFILCFLTGIIGLLVLASSSSSAKSADVQELDDDAELPQDDTPLSLRIATLAAAQAEEEAAKKKVMAAAVQRTPKFVFDEAEWDRLLASDREISDAADAVRAIGLTYEDELAASFLKDKDKSRLPLIVEAIRKKAK